MKLARVKATLYGLFGLSVIAYVLLIFVALEYASATERIVTLHVVPHVPITTGIREASPYRPAPTRSWLKPNPGVYSLPGNQGAPANGCEDRGGFRVVSGPTRGCIGGP